MFFNCRFLDDVKKLRVGLLRLVGFLRLRFEAFKFILLFISEVCFGGGALGLLKMLELLALRPFRLTQVMLDHIKARLIHGKTLGKCASSSVPLAACKGAPERTFLRKPEGGSCSSSLLPKSPFSTINQAFLIFQMPTRVVYVKLVVSELAGNQHGKYDSL